MNKKIVVGVTGLSDAFHDNSVAIFNNGKLLFAASEERYSRQKHDRSFPEKALKSGLKYLNLKLSDVSVIAVGYPKRKMWSVIAGKWGEFIKLGLQLLVNRNFKLFSDLKIILAEDQLQNNESALNNHPNLAKKEVVYVDHHLAHAASAYYCSGFSDCLTLAMDAFGSNIDGQIRSGAVFLGQNGNLDEVYSIPVSGSIGLFYQAMTLVLDFTPGDGEGKTMGFAAYGNGQKLVKKLQKYAPSFNKGAWKPGQDSLSLFFTTQKKYQNLFYATNVGKYLQNLLKTEKPEDIAAATQFIFEREMMKFVKYLLTKYPKIENIALAGGIFLNVKSNKMIRELDQIKNVFVQPHAGDGGVAVGAGYVVSKDLGIKINNELLISAGLGEDFTDKEIKNELDKYRTKLVYRKSKNVAVDTVTEILNKNVVGWFQGRAEWGPRALGFRSVLADPRDKAVKERINAVLKSRDWFMPFAPSVLESEASKYFVNCKSSPFMTVVYDVVRGKERLIPAAIHVDNTARPNTVNEKNNKLYYAVLNQFFQQTKVPVLLNTSFNKHGLPVVNHPKDAIEHLLMSAVDCLVIGSYIVRVR